ncbi:MAG: YqgE/AlgH family protein [Rhodospirillales bacterium]|nr:MAG: YqgE/AlgH family protein [Rhodospirillales bacterium]
MVDQDDTQGYLTGQLLIAMPNMQDPRFERSVIYLCVHNAEGAMGLVINQIADELSFPDLLDQLGIETLGGEAGIPIHVGGPVESGRGFVLHTSDYAQNSTIRVNETVSLTATVDILKDIADGRGPRRALLALGYAGWGAGQLDGEIQQNSWLNVNADESLLFGDHPDTKWEQSLAKLGIDLSLLSGEAGHA